MSSLVTRYILNTVLVCIQTQFIETFSFDLRLCGLHLGGHQLGLAAIFGFVVCGWRSPPTVTEKGMPIAFWIYIALIGIKTVSDVK